MALLGAPGGGKPALRWSGRGGPPATGPEAGAGGEGAADAAGGRPSSWCQNGSGKTSSCSELIDAVGELVGVTEEAGEEEARAVGAEAERPREPTSGRVNTLFKRSIGIGVASGEAGRDFGDAYMAARQVAGSLMMIVVTFGSRRLNAFPTGSLVLVAAL